MNGSLHSRGRIAVKDKSRSIAIRPAHKPAELTAATRQQTAIRQAQRDIIYWTTKDGREIPLEDMSDDHIANATRVLSLWRMRLKKRDRESPVLKDLADAIQRFKSIVRKRQKSIQRAEKAATSRRFISR